MPNHPSLIEVDLVWPGEYKTMLTFHKDDFNEGVNRGKVIIEAHVGMVKRHIDQEAIAVMIKTICTPNRSAEK